MIKKVWLCVLILSKKKKIPRSHLRSGETSGRESSHDSLSSPELLSVKQLSSLKLLTHIQYMKGVRCLKAAVFEDVVRVSV